MIEKIWGLLSTFTPESEKTVKAKIVEFGFDPNRGEVSLNESYINFNTIVALLKESIEQKKLIQLPISIQKIVLNHLEAINKTQANLIGGSDEILNLEVHIENLNSALWQYGLFNLSSEVLGYQTKLNQLKQLELEVSNLRDDLKEGVKQKKKLDEAQGSAQSKLDALENTLATATTQLSEISQKLAESNTNSQQIAAIFSTVQQNEKVISDAKANSVQNNSEVDSLKTKIKEFFSEITTHKTSIDSTATKADIAIKNNQVETEALILNLSELENQIKDQLQKATGHSLFHSFQTRQGLINTSKNFWMYVLAGLLIISAVLTVYLINTISGINTAFFLKLSLSIPLIFAISFATIQYSRERRLEEEYAFKSNISISLIPYQELVEKLVNEADKEQKKEYASFMMNTINKVFTSPTEHIFHEKSSGSLIDTKALKKISEIIESLSKIKA